MTIIATLSSEAVKSIGNKRMRYTFSRSRVLAVFSRSKEDEAEFDNDTWSGGPNGDGRNYWIPGGFVGPDSVGCREPCLGC